MLDAKQFISAITQIAEEKGIPQDRVVETIEAAIAAAYKKDYGEKGQIIRTKLNQETGDVKVWQVKIVVEGADEEGYVIGDLPLPADMKREDEIKEFREERRSPVNGPVKEGEEIQEGEEGEDIKIKFNSDKHVALEDAKKDNKKAKVGDEIITGLEPKMEFGRIAAQTAKQVIIQRLREVEREAVFKEFKKLEGEIISGVVQRIEGRTIFVDLGRTNGILVVVEQVQNDRYRINQRLKFLVLRVEETNKGPAIFLSRSHPRLVTKLFEFEVPEIEAGTVEIKSIAREAGSRSKVAVSSNEENVDPIGSLVGQKGVRVQTVINELGGEKIDIIEWKEDLAKYISNALAPAKILDVKVLSEENKHALAEVADDQFSLAIGKKGQNVRLAAKLTGWKIDVRSPKENMTADIAETAETSESPETLEAPEVIEEKGVEPTESKKDKKEEDAIVEEKAEDKKE
ncbi:MAG: transcription termination factor NusA [bacterium]|nr:transcription termination factor NusA [bacterium]